MLGYASRGLCESFSIWEIFTIVVSWMRASKIVATIIPVDETVSGFNG
jgi:hypothetical protein